MRQNRRNRLITRQIISESLESRRLLSALPNPSASPVDSAIPLGGSIPAGQASPPGFSPAQIRAAYGISDVTFNSVAGTGAALALVVLAGAAFFLRSPLPPPTIVGTAQLTSDGIAKGGLITDGSRLYFSEFSGDHFIVSQVSIAGGENAAIATPVAGSIVLDVAPDSSQLLLGEAKFFQLDGPFWLQPMPAGSPRNAP